MNTPQDVLISGERHLIIHGQLGNLSVKITRLGHLLEAAGGDQFLPSLEEIGGELAFLKEMYPALDGAVTYGSLLPKKGDSNPGPARDKVWDDRRLVRKKLRDMRALIDAASLSYTHEGSIACHLKAMFDEAWTSAAEAVGLSGLEEDPF